MHACPLYLAPPSPPPPTPGWHADAINLAVRFGAAIYVNNEIAARMAHPLQAYEPRDESQTEIVRSCK